MLQVPGGTDIFFLSRILVSIKVKQVTVFKSDIQTFFSCIMYKICISQNKLDLEYGVHMSKRATCFDLSYVIVKLAIPKYIH